MKLECHKAHIIPIQSISPDSAPIHLRSLETTRPGRRNEVPSPGSAATGSDLWGVYADGAALAGGDHAPVRTEAPRMATNKRQEAC